MNIFRQVMNYLEIVKCGFKVLSMRTKYIIKKSAYIYSSIK